MVQVLPAIQRGPSRSSQIGAALSAGAGSLLEQYQQREQVKEQQQQINQENESFKNQYGIDLSPYKNPETRAEIMKNALQGNLEETKQSAKYKAKADALRPLFSRKNKGQNFVNEIMQEPEIEENPKFELPSFGEKSQERPRNKIVPQRKINKLIFNEQEPVLPYLQEQIDEALALGEPAIAQRMQADNKTALELHQREEDIRRKEEEFKHAERTSKEKEYFKINEPKVMQLGEDERKLKQEEGRYNRLGELFSDPTKFPSSLTASLFTKDGQINDVVYSQMTPEAQEAVKLIIDSTSNIKDTYGSRVTNFDLQTYLRKLPSLLNTSEGKSRVLRDLKIMNRINQLHASGIQQIFEEYGGTDKIPYSKAESLYRKKYGDQEKQLLDQFVNPEKASFEKLPDANKYLGRKIKNPETGEIFISDGIEWKPFKG